MQIAIPMQCKLMYFRFSDNNHYNNNNFSLFIHKKNTSNKRTQSYGYKFVAFSSIECE